MVFHSLSVKCGVELPDSKSTHIRALKCIYMYWNLLYTLVSLKCCVSCSVVSNSLQPPWTVATGLLCSWDFPDKNTGMGCHFLLQGIFPTQGLNPRLSHCRWILYRLNYKGAVLSSLQKLKGSIHLYSFLTSVLHENFRKKVLNKCAYWQLILNNVLKRTDFPNLSIWLVMYILLLKGKLKATFSSKYLRVGTKSV